MLVPLWALNNFTAYKLLTAYHGVLSDNYRYQTTSNSEKLLDFEGVENSLMITGPIFQVFYIYIEPTRLLRDNDFNSKFDVNKKLRPESIRLDWGDSGEIEEVITTDKDDKDEKDLQERNRQLKREKQNQKQAAKAKTLPTSKTRCQ